MTDVSSGTPTPAGPKPGPRPTGAGSPTPRPQSRPSHASLHTEHGNTEIGDQVVAKIAGWAAREIPGVHEMGRGAARTIGSLRSRLPGQSDGGDISQGVSVEVGERQAAIDLDLVTEYGESIVDISQAVRANVIEKIETMTGLEVKEVNIRVDDLFVEGLQDSGEDNESRVE